MADSKAWEWSLVDKRIWLSPSEESYYLCERWREKNFSELLDFGCGLGRHSVFFANRGFNVSAFDLSEEGVNNLSDWAKSEGITVKAVVADMKSLPYPGEKFDCLFAYHVISHADTAGMAQIAGEIARVLRPGGEIYITLCSKDTPSFKDGRFPKLDENTIVKTAEGPENGVPHFYVSLQDIPRLLPGFQVISVRHTDDCYREGYIPHSIHYFILARRLGEGE